MSENIEKLQKIGAQKINLDTHIPLEHIKALLQEKFEGFSKIQFLGFIAILEREYDVDLTQLRQKGIMFFEEKEKASTEIYHHDLFVSPAKKRNFTPLYIAVIVLIVFVGAYLTLNQSNTQEGLLLDTQLLEDVAKNKALIEEINASKELNNTQDEHNLTLLIPQEEEVEIIEAPQEKVIVESLKIKPRSRVWMGYIDLTNYKKYQKTFKNELELDPSKEWLLTFGHGYIDIIVDGEVKKFTSRNSVKFHYKDGKIQEISAQEFKRFNRGRSW
jgi:hypothetical protein